MSYVDLLFRTPTTTNEKMDIVTSYNTLQPNIHKILNTVMQVV